MEDSEVPGLRGVLRLGSVWLTFLAFMLGLGAATAGSLGGFILSFVLCGAMALAAVAFFILAMSPELSEAEDFLRASLAYHRHQTRGFGPGGWYSGPNRREASRAA